MSLSLLTACANSMEEVEQVSAPVVFYPLSEQHGAILSFTDSGRVVLTIEAGLMQDFGNVDPSYVSFKEGVKVSFFGGKRKAATTLIADTARRLTQDEVWAIGGNVLVKNKNGERMRTELLYWDQKNEKLFSERRVQIETEEQLIIGEGFEADQEFSSYRLYKVTGEITIDDE